MGRWATCEKCGLRVGYWPGTDTPARHRDNTPAHVVNMALTNLLSAGIWEDMDYQTMHAEIEKVSAEIKREHEAEVRREREAKKTAAAVDKAVRLQLKQDAKAHGGGMASATQRLPKSYSSQEIRTFHQKQHFPSNGYALRWGWPQIWDSEIR